MSNQGHLVECYACMAHSVPCVTSDQAQNMKCPYKTDHEQSRSILACRAFDHTHSLTVLHRIVDKSCKQTSDLHYSSGNNKKE